VSTDIRIPRQYVHIYVYLYACVCVCVYVRVCIYAHICVCMCMCVCICVYTQYAVGGGWGAPHFGSRGFGSEDNSGGEIEAGNIEYICM